MANIYNLYDRAHGLFSNTENEEVEIIRGLMRVLDIDPDVHGSRVPAEVLAAVECAKCNRREEFASWCMVHRMIHHKGAIDVRYKES